jgi:8-oxo-dGTP pyrophosphatase MutT (NUDIX family)
MNDRNSAPRVGAVILLRDDGAALLQLRDVKPGLPRSGMWVVPGGHAEPGEAMDDCARREFREETAYDCAELRFLYSVVDVNDVTGDPYDLFLYWERYDGQSPTICLEGQELRFFPRELAGGLDMPACLLAAWDAALAVRNGAATREKIGQAS